MKEKAADAVSEKFTEEERAQLNQYLEKQCRYQLVRFEPSGIVLGGIAVIDQQTGIATLWLALNPHGGWASAVVGTTQVPETDTSSGRLDIRFSTLE